MNKIVIAAAALAATVVPAAAFAHSGDHGLKGIVAGLMHPLLGLDHLLALVAAGVWLSLQKRSNRLHLGGAFIATLAVGIALGAVFSRVTFEGGITATLVGLGALLAFALRAPAGVSALVLASVAGVHGFVHGTELPMAAGTFAFSVGLVLASAAIFVASVAVGQLAQARQSLLGAQAVGVAIAVFGVSVFF